MNVLTSWMRMVAPVAACTTASQGRVSPLRARLQPSRDASARPKACAQCTTGKLSSRARFRASFTCSTASRRPPSCATCQGPHRWESKIPGAINVWHWCRPATAPVTQDQQSRATASVGTGRARCIDEVLDRCWHQKRLERHSPEHFLSTNEGRLGGRLLLSHAHWIEHHHLGHLDGDCRAQTLNITRRSGTREGSLWQTCWDPWSGGRGRVLEVSM